MIKLSIVAHYYIILGPFSAKLSAKFQVTMLIKNTLLFVYSVTL